GVEDPGFSRLEGHRLVVPSIALLARDVATSAGNTSPSSAASQRPCFTAVGPLTHVSATLISPPFTVNTRPVMPSLCGLASHTTTGAMLAGEPTSKPARSLSSRTLAT